MGSRLRALLPRSWFVRGSIAIHLVLFGVLIWRPGFWPFVVSILVLDHLVLVAAGLWPKSGLLGPNLRRLPERHARKGHVALMFDDGPDPETTPRILEVLASHGAKATFFCIGRRAERYPELIAAMTRRGHRVENHTYRHTHRFFFLGPHGLAREIDRAQSVLKETTGVCPTYFRAPAGLRSPLLDFVLAARGLHLVSWTRRGLDTIARDASVIVGRLVTNLRPGDLLLLHDGNPARDRSGRPLVLKTLPVLLDRMTSLGLRSVALPDAAMLDAAKDP